MPKIFYAHSSNEEDSIYKTFKNICDIIDKDNKIIINVNNSKEALLIDAITESINECDLFICDITPDYEHFDNILVNSNVMFELGYAYKNIPKENIIILLDENKTKKRPSILEGYLYTAYLYDSENIDYCDDIIKVINEKINDIKQNGKWMYINYKLSNRFIYLINNLINSKKSKFNIKINPDYTKIFIFINNDKEEYSINVFQRTITINNKITNLEDIIEVYDELRYIEMLARTCWMK